MSRKRKTIPDVENEAEERAFWESNDSSDYLCQGSSALERSTAAVHRAG